MAKLGEGDPRWLVTDRDDGKNVNNWHWSEKSLYSWVKSQLEELLKNKLIFENESQKVWVDSLDSLKGDILVSNRKGRNIFLWDVNLTVVWSGEIKDLPKTTPLIAKGKLECLNVTVVDNDYDTKFTLDEGSDKRGSELLAIVRKHGPKVVMDVFQSITKRMIEDHKDSRCTAISSPAESRSPALSVSTVTSTSTGKEMNVRSIHQLVKFQIPAKVLYDVLLNPQSVSAFTGSAAQISDELGSQFKLFGGNVCGHLEEKVPGVKIAQKWRFSSWPEGHYSFVTFDLEDKGNRCRLKLTQTGVPESDWERTRRGWDEHFWQRIRGVFGWDYKVQQ